MEYRKIISVTGLGGLFELITSKADGAVLRSLEDKTTKFVSSRIHNFSNLETIEIFTTSAENINLADVFIAMRDSSETVPDAKADGKALQAYFGKIVPEMDMERVYASDMKKIVKWFAILTANNVDFKSPVNEEEGEEEQQNESVIEEIAGEEVKPEEGSLKNSK
jgi:hypothetical protein